LIWLLLALPLLIRLSVVAVVVMFRAWAKQSGRAGRGRHKLFALKWASNDSRPGVTAAGRKRRHAAYHTQHNPLPRPVSARLDETVAKIIRGAAEIVSAGVCGMKQSPKDIQVYTALLRYTAYALFLFGLTEREGQSEIPQPRYSRPAFITHTDMESQDSRY
jgi:hypothetical protein